MFSLSDHWFWYFQCCINESPDRSRTSTSVWRRRAPRCRCCAGLAGELAPPGRGRSWPRQRSSTVPPSWCTPTRSVDKGGHVKTDESHCQLVDVRNCGVRLQQIERWEGLPKVAVRGLMTHQLWIWRHFLVLAVVSLQLLVGHELQSSVRGAEQTGNVALEGWRDVERILFLVLSRNCHHEIK